MRLEFWEAAGRELLLQGMQVSEQAGLAPLPDPHQAPGASIPLKTFAVFPAMCKKQGLDRQWLLRMGIFTGAGC